MNEPKDKIKVVQSPKPVSEAKQLDAEIAGELRKWDEAQLAVENLNVDVPRLDMKVQTLIAIVEDKLGMSKDEINLYFKRATLAYLKEIREEIQPQVEEERRNALIARSIPKIDIPGKLH